MDRLSGGPSDSEGGDLKSGDLKSGDLNGGDIRTQLVENNPFASSAAPNPWDNANPDIDSLNRTVVDHIEQLLRTKRLDSALPLAGLILGEPGTGKTHMLKRVLGKIRKNGQIAIFVAVRAFMNPGSVMRDLLREVFISMAREHRDGKLQIDLLLEELDESYRERCREEGGTARSGMDRLKPLQMQLLGIDRDFLRCLLLYADTEDVSLKEDILFWLMGESDESFSERLGVPDCDRDAMAPEVREDEASKMLLSLGHVLRYARVPMLVCFDQLDGMDAPDLINAWGKVLSLLVNNVSGMLPLAFLRADTWNHRFSRVLDSAVVQRFSHPVPMGNCSLDQARQLVKNRISAFFVEGAEEKYRWLMARLEGKLRMGYSPRTVIDLANRAIQEDGSEPPSEKTGGTVSLETVGTDEVQEAERTLTAAYREECDKVASDPNSWPPNADQLLDALEMWLGSRPEFNVSRSDDKYVRLSGQRSAGGRVTPCAFIVLTARNHLSAAAALKRGIDFLSAHPDGLCCYVTDGRAFKGPENWKKVHDLLGQFRALEGRAVILESGGRAAWYGLVAFRNKVCNGDVALYPSSGQRPATREDFSRYMKEGFRPELLDLGGEGDAPDDDPGGDVPPAAEPGKADGSATDEERLTRAVLSLLEGSPMKMMGAELLVGALHREGVAIGYQTLLAGLNRQKALFRLYPSGNGTLIAMV